MPAVIIHRNFGAQENKTCPRFQFFPHQFSIKWWDQMPWSSFFWILSFKPAFSLSCFPFIKRLFSSSSLSAIRVLLSVYLRLLIFLPEILIPACNSSSLTIHMKYSAYKLRKQGDSVQPCGTPFPILNQSVVSCPVLLLLDQHTGFSGDG